MSTLTEITTVEDWHNHLSSLPASTLLIVSFHAPWAAPCAQMAAVLSTLASEYPRSSPLATSWVSINAEDLSDISETYHVTAVPFLVLIRDNTVLESVSGSSAAKVRNAIEAHAGAGQSAAKATDKAAAPATPTPSAPPNTTNGQQPRGLGGEELDPVKQKEELFRRLADLVKAAPVMLFMKGIPSEPKCGFSRQLVAILREHSVKYGFFNILADDEVRQGLKEFGEWPTYPQLWVNGELVGGLDIVKEELANNPDYFVPHSVKTVPTD